MLGEVGKQRQGSLPDGPRAVAIELETEDHVRRGSLYARLSVAGGAATHHQRWATIDTVRALAALMVLVAHAPKVVAPDPARDSTTLRVADAFANGVWLFFAVSGFLIAGPFLRALLGGRRLPPVGRYAFRRAARIYPGYWVALAAILILVTGSSVTRWWELPVHASLVHGLVPGESQRLFSVAWTLGLEAIFYALVPLGAIVVWRLLDRERRGVDVDRLAKIVLGLWLFSVAWGVALAVAHPWGVGEGPLPRSYTVLLVVVGLGNFCPGLLVYLAETDQARGRGGWWAAYRAVVSRPLPAIAGALALWLVVELLPTKTDGMAFVGFHPIIGVASALVLGACLHGTWLRRAARILAPIGLISYGIYLWHWVVVTALRHHDLYPFDGVGPAQVVVHIAVVFAITAPIALLSWLLLERPLLRRTTMWDRRKEPRSAGARVAAIGHAETEPAGGPVT